MLVVLDEISRKLFDASFENKDRHAKPESIFSMRLLKLF